MNDDDDNNNNNNNDGSRGILLLLLLLLNSFHPLGPGVAFRFYYKVKSLRANKTRVETPTKVVD